MANPAKQRLSASDIRIAMAKRWSAPEYAIMWEVGEATGAMRGRYADAVIMSLWPSRGLELHGVEIKVSRSDWKREAADPAKAEAIARYCDRWWIHTPPGVVGDLSDLPPAWGLREFDGKSWSTVREAEKTAAEPTTRAFLAAMLRRADGAMRSMIADAVREGMTEIDRERDKERSRFNEQVEAAAKRRTSHVDEAMKNIEVFETAFGGGSLRNWALNYASLGRAALALSNCGPNGYPSLSKRLRAAADEIDAITGMIEEIKP